MCIKSMRMIAPHNTVLTAGVKAVCASLHLHPSEGLLTYSGAPGGGGGEVVGHSGSRYAINTWHISTVGMCWQTQTHYQQYWKADRCLENLIEYLNPVPRTARVKAKAAGVTVTLPCIWSGCGFRVQISMCPFERLQIVESVTIN